MPYQPDICIFHDNCDDGFASAWIVNQKWNDVDFRPCNYGQPAPADDIDGKHVLVADFSFPPLIVEQLAERATSLLILDHHKTAKADLEGLHAVVRPTWENVSRCFARMTGTWREKVLAEFDMDRSGARMTWDFCFPGETPPSLVLAVEDRDLWKFERPDTKQVSMYLRSLPRDFSDWSAAASLYSDDPERFLSTADAIKRFYDLRVKEMAESATVRRFADHDGVPVAYVPYAFISDVCHDLLAMHPDAPFAVAVVEANGGTTCSMRSADGRLDVSEIAKKHGGGGHRNAAGFRLPI